ncbi:hypothetical protein [Calothrix sp. 336/3]|uniref:hypothetical protein n=1 Tax=Calothrix sp. 336/3 TaxID=1337936 RepID=UPI0004E2EE36|nr:hypothetical protein [Calothrix sp. 336/3]AKG23666.1 hypothetical protein IJ00_22370 [Calothrix sp. 336/3]
MSSGIYAIAHIGNFQLYVGEVHRISQKWPPLLALLNSGGYPHQQLQEEWQREGDKRHFSFHTKEEILADKKIIGIEELITLVTE